MGVLCKTEYTFVVVFEKDHFMFHLNLLLYES